MRLFFYPWALNWLFAWVSYVHITPSLPASCCLVVSLTHDLGARADPLTQASLPVSGCLSAVAACHCVSKWCAFKFLCVCNHVCQVHAEHTLYMIYSLGAKAEWPRERLAPSELITSWFWFPPDSLPLCHTYCMFQSRQAVWLLRNRAGQVARTFALLFFFKILFHMNRNKIMMSFGQPSHNISY